MIRALIVCFCLVVLPLGASARESGPGQKSSVSPAKTDEAADQGAQDGAFDVRLRALRERVEELKGRVFDSKTRLLLLREQIMHNLVSESRTKIVHRNMLSSSLDVEEVSYFLDNEKVYFRTNRDGKLADADVLEVFSGSVASGNHVLTVEMKVRARNAMFTYVEGYAFKIKSSFTFFANPGMEAQVNVEAFEKGGLAAPLEERPSVRFGLMQKRLMAADGAVQADQDAGAAR